MLEDGSDEVQEKVDRCHAAGSSWIAYAELHAALARRHREGDIGKRDFQECLEVFGRDWEKFSRLVCDETVARAAGDLALRHRLRGMDAVHLASAVRFRDQNPSADLEFLSADARLQEAARKEGFRGGFKG